MCLICYNVNILKKSANTRNVSTLAQNQWAVGFNCSQPFGEVFKQQKITASPCRGRLFFSFAPIFFY